MTDDANRNRVQIKSIKRRMQSGEITYDEAADLCAPIIKSINDTGRRIAKRMGVPMKTVTFTELIRNVK